MYCTFYNGKLIKTSEDLLSTFEEIYTMCEKNNINNDKYKSQYGIMKFSIFGFDNYDKKIFDMVYEL